MQSSDISAVRVMLFNATITLNTCGSKRASVGMCLHNEFHPVLVLENPRYSDAKVILTYDEWTCLCDSSMYIAGMFNGTVQAPSLELGDHTVSSSRFPQTVKIYNGSECIHLHEKTFKNLMYASFKIDHAFNERLSWQPYVYRFYEGIWSKLLKFASSTVQHPSEASIAQHFDICREVINVDIYEPDMPDVGLELRSYLGMYIYPTICSSL